MKDINNEIKNLCENIKLLRSENRLSKKDMAKLLGISYNSLTLIEKGVLPKIGYNMLYKIYYNFNISPEKMFSPLSKDNVNKKWNG